MKAVVMFAFIIAADDHVRTTVSKLVTSLGIRAVAFGSAAEFLASPRRAVPACLIMEVELPDTNGLDLQKRLADEDHPPIVFITSCADIPSTVRAMKRGAVDVLVKPVREADLVRAISAALNLDYVLRSDRAERDALQQRLSALTPREREVLPLIVSGLLNKQAAADLGISEVTYQIHRSNVMRKMRAHSLADLVRMAEKLPIPVTRSRFISRPRIDNSLPAARLFGLPPRAGAKNDPKTNICLRERLNNPALRRVR